MLKYLYSQIFAAEIYLKIKYGSFFIQILCAFFYGKSEQKVAAGFPLIANLELYTVRC